MVGEPETLRYHKMHTMGDKVLKTKPKPEAALAAKRRHVYELPTT